MHQANIQFLKEFDKNYPLVGLLAGTQTIITISPESSIENGIRLRMRNVRNDTIMIKIFLENPITEYFENLRQLPALERPLDLVGANFDRYLSIGQIFVCCKRSDKISDLDKTIYFLEMVDGSKINGHIKVKFRITDDLENFINTSGNYRVSTLSHIEKTFMLLGIMSATDNIKDFISRKRNKKFINTLNTSAILEKLFGQYFENINSKEENPSIKENLSFKDKYKSRTWLACKSFLGEPLLLKIVDKSDTGAKVFLKSEETSFVSGPYWFNYKYILEMFKDFQEISINEDFIKGPCPKFKEINLYKGQIFYVKVRKKFPKEIAVPDFYIQVEDILPNNIIKSKEAGTLEDLQNPNKGFSLAMHLNKLDSTLIIMGEVAQNSIDPILTKILYGIPGEGKTVTVADEAIKQSELIKKLFAPNFDSERRCDTLKPLISKKYYAAIDNFRHKIEVLEVIKEINNLDNLQVTSWSTTDLRKKDLESMFDRKSFYNRYTLLSELDFLDDRVCLKRNKSLEKDNIVLGATLLMHNTITEKLHHICIVEEMHTFDVHTDTINSYYEFMDLQTNIRGKCVASDTLKYKILGFCPIKLPANPILL